jgi:hypothetical protein
MSTRGAKPPHDGPHETAAGLNDGQYQQISRPAAETSQDPHGLPADVASARAKAQLKGKVTADKWNQ